MPVLKKLLLLLILFTFLKLSAQKGLVSGYVFSAADNTPMHNAVILLLRAKDSTLYRFTRSLNDGSYKFTNTDTGKYLLKCSYPACADYVDTFRLNPYQTNRIDTIRIINKAVAIQEILIKKYTNGIRIVGDTTEYLADFFKTNPGATVEDLLKKLPGIQVNKNGEITAQGEQVKKILVDGEEFFPEDPTIATKYLRADMIEKVQIYDHREDTMSKSNDDKVKTMNLTLKQDKKKGYFGKVEAGSNFDKYTNDGAFAGYFNKKMKGAVYAKNSNFEDASLGWGEGNQYGGTASGAYTPGDNYGTYYNNTSYNDQLDNRGIPFNTSGGAAFNNSWDSSKVKIKLASSYRFAHEGVNGTITGNSRYFLPDTSYSIRDTTINKSVQDGHRANVSLTIQADSFNTFTITGNGSVSNGNTNSALNSGTAASRQINHSARTLQNSFNKEQLSLQMQWNRKFRKNGKFFRTDVSYGFAPNSQDQVLQSENLFYAEAGQIEKKQNLDQLKQFRNASSNGSLRASYGNRINKYFNYSINYRFSFQEDKNRVNSFNRENGVLSSTIDSLSNNYHYDQLKNSAGFSIQYNRRKWTYWATASGGTSNYLQKNISHPATQTRNFINFFPSLGMTYSWKKQSNVQLYYSGYNQAPSLAALQPVVNNSDPFDIKVGNTKLVQSFSHSLNVYFHNNQTVKGRYLSGSLNASLPRNDFVTSTSVDTNAVRHTMTVNANGNYNLNSRIGYYMKLKKLPVYVSSNVNGTRSRAISFTNEQRINTNRSVISGSLGLGLNTDNVSINLNYDISWNSSQNSLRGTKPTTYFIKTPSYEIEIKLPKNFRIYHSGDFNIRPSTGVFSQNRNVYYLTAELGKSFGKHRNFECSFFMNDLLNQNVGFNRDISTNRVYEQVYTQLARYWLVKLRWNFSSTGGKAGDDDDD